MDIFGDMTTLVTLAIAVFIFLRLRSVLGKRTGHQPPPMDQRSRREDQGGARPANDDNIVTLPTRGARQDDTTKAAQAGGEIDAIAKSGTKLNRQLKDISAADPSFSPAAFLDGAKMAYEMIVTAFADGDRKTLKNLLARDVYDGFSGAISERESRSEQVRSTFVGVESAKITGAELSGHDEHITVRFVSQIISATYDKDDQLVDGDPDQVAEVTDLWTFARDTRSSDPNWKLVATESES